MSEKKWYIYMVTNKVNKRSYVGQTSKTVAVRWRQHICEALNENRKLNEFHNAIRCAGPETFEVKTLCECKSQYDADCVERYYIYSYNTYQHGYNTTLGGRFKR